MHSAQILQLCLRKSRRRCHVKNKVINNLRKCVNRCSSRSPTILKDIRKKIYTRFTIFRCMYWNMLLRQQINGRRDVAKIKKRLKSTGQKSCIETGTRSFNSCLKLNAALRWTALYLFQNRNTIWNSRMKIIKLFKRFGQG